MEGDLNFNLKEGEFVYFVYLFSGQFQLLLTVVLFTY